MSTLLLSKEVRRFLESNEPEVLCITGKWGVGKTFLWRKYLIEAASEKKCGMKQYSYVSLFGLNSLEDLRYAIFEGTVETIGSDLRPDPRSIAARIRRGFGTAAPWIDAIGSRFGLGGIGAAITKSAFMLVEKQIVCFDDLERAGEGLRQRDVLGLASALKEQRDCKVVLLLNEQEMDEEARREFRQQLEKVVDVFLELAPSPSEACSIALPVSDGSNLILRERMIQLGIVNIRVIRKIERLTKRILTIVGSCDARVQDQAVTAVALGGWAVLQRECAPSIEYLRSYNRVSYGMQGKRGETGEVEDAEDAWMAILRDYPFLFSDDLDKLIFDGVRSGFFDEMAILEAAKGVELSLASDPLNNSFAKAWDLYHGSLSVEDDVVLDAMYAGAMENLRNTSPASMNTLIKLFREIGRGNQADEVLSAFVEAHSDRREFFDLERSMFMEGDGVDPHLQRAFDDKYNAFVDERDPKSVLLSAAESSSWSDVDVRLLSKLSAEEFETLFQSIQGRPLGRAISIALSMARDPSGAEPTEFSKALRGGLSRIAAKSPLRARRLRQYGIAPDQ